MLPDPPVPPIDLDPDFLTVEYTGIQHGAGTDDQVITWCADLCVTPDSALHEQDGDRLRDQGDADWFQVARAELFWLDIVRARPNPAWALDDFSAAAERFVFLFSDGELDPRLGDEGIEVGTPASVLLVVDGLWVHPDWRGRRLGPWLVARALMTLASTDSIVAAHDNAHEIQEHPDLDRVAESGRIGNIWRQLGFRYYQNGIFVLDPNWSALEDASDALRRTAGRLPDG